VQNRIVFPKKGAGNFATENSITSLVRYLQSGVATEHLSGGRGSEKTGDDPKSCFSIGGRRSEKNVKIKKRD